MTIPGHPRIAIDPSVCGGRPTIAGTRLRVSGILEALGSGATEAELLQDFPYLGAEDVRAALRYAASVAVHPFTS
jgi:uncharacterized protein (DUF433 family)